MPTTHGSLLFKGRPPGRARLDPRRPACGRPARCRSARRRRPSSAPCNFTEDRRPGASPATRGTRPHAGRVERRLGGRGGGRAWCPFATASDGGGSTRIPGRVQRAGRPQAPATAASRTRAPERVADRRRRRADDDRRRRGARTSTCVAGPDDRDRTSLPPPGRRTYEAAIESLDVAGLRARLVGSTSASPSSIPRWRSWPRAGAEALAAAAGLELDDEPVQLTDPVRTWLARGRIDLWLDIDDGACGRPVADDLTPLLPPRARSNRRPIRTAAALRCGVRRRARLEARAGGHLRATSTCCSPPRRRCRRSPPRVRRPTVIAGRDGPPWP